MRINVDGRIVFATTGGAPFDPAKPVVIFLHGAGFDRTAWRLQTRFFAHHGHAVVSVDFPDHGWSDGPALTSIAAMADWTAKLIDAIGLESAALVGHSMGALVALDAAARYPEKVRALGLCGVATEMPVHPEMLESAKADTLKVQELMTFWGLGNALHKGGMVTPGLWLRLGGVVGQQAGRHSHRSRGLQRLQGRARAGTGREVPDRAGLGRWRSDDTRPESQGPERRDRWLEDRHHRELRALHDDRAA